MAKKANEQEMRYYKGEKSNPFEEINEKQGAHAERYNYIAGWFWNFECWWALGWDKYKGVEGTTWMYFFEQHKEPQKEFKSLEAALVAFGFALDEEWCSCACKRYITYLYNNAHLERFYKPLFNIVPADELPSYYKWYKGENSNPYKYYSDIERGVLANMWWELEHGHYMATENLQISSQQWHSFVQGKIDRVAGANKEAQQKHWESYNKQ